MLDLFQGFSTFAVFLAIAAVGFLFLLISLIFGEIFDHLGDGADHDMDHGADHGDHGGPSFFSPRVMSVFITAFGGTGAIASHYGASTLAASGIGSVSGVCFATVIYYFAKFLFSQQATTEVKATDVVGQTARVVVGIPKDGVGQVRCRVGDELLDKIARSESGEPIPENTPVRVEQVLGEIIIVKRI